MRTPLTRQPLVALRQARQHLLEFGHCPSGVLDERLARSWARSLAAGLLPTGRALADGLPGDGVLRQALAASQALLAHSRPVMEYLFEQLRRSHGVVVLADPQGMLVHTLGDPHFVGKAERVALMRGASWHEAHRGTNAIGTALAERGAVQVHGGEHFLERNGFLTCAAAPIFSATGELLGVLDISGDHRSGHAHGHTLGLVGMAVRMIENRLLASSCRRHLRLHLHAQREGIGSVAEGIVAISGDGLIVGVNRAALALLGLRSADVGATPLARVLDVRLPALLAHHRRRPQQPLALRRAGDAPLYALVQMDAGAAPAAFGLAGAPLPVADAAQGHVPTHVLADAPRDALERLGHGDARWRAAADKARRVAGKGIALLIQGESGVGKELFARAWHASGPRAQGPFVAINCAAIPESLIEAELFGYVGGAFTGARTGGSAGRLREAHGGTLLLDEIGDMPLALQTRLLRVLQERSVTPVGAGRAVAVDFALACATHADLEQAVRQGRFRHDLYYRLNGLTVQLPALRERGDFAALTQHLLAQAAAEQGLPQPPRLAPGLLAALAAQPWPGNLRQYASVLRTACAMLDAGEDVLGWQHLPEGIAPEGIAPHAMALARPAPGPAPAPALPPLSLRQLSRAAIEQALEGARGNLSQAARQLGISRQTLYRKLAQAR